MLVETMYSDTCSAMQLNKVYCVACLVNREESWWLKLFQDRMSEHGPVVHLFAGRGVLGERNSYAPEVEKVDRVHISLLGQPGD